MIDRFFPYLAGIFSSSLWTGTQNCCCLGTAGFLVEDRTFDSLEDMSTFGRVHQVQLDLPEDWRGTALWETAKQRSVVS